jgi:hypothetical protein
LLLSFQLVSEFVINEIRREDEGSFYCSASNPAGVATANFTLIVKTSDSSVEEGNGGARESGGGETSVTVVEGSAADGEDDDVMIKVRVVGA